MSDAARPLSSEAQILAERVAEVMYARDQASQALGMKIVEVRPGYARMPMLVRNDMLNGHAKCHGGFISALADSAFGFTCNGRNQTTVASVHAIEYLAPGREGATLSAEACEQGTPGRTADYDFAVMDEDGQRIAVFRGKSYRAKGEVIAGMNTASR